MQVNKVKLFYDNCGNDFRSYHLHFINKMFSLYNPSTFLHSKVYIISENHSEVPQRLTPFSFGLPFSSTTDVTPQWLSVIFASVCVSTNAVALN